MQLSYMHDQNHRVSRIILRPAQKQSKTQSKWPNLHQSNSVQVGGKWFGSGRTVEPEKLAVGLSEFTAQRHDGRRLELKTANPTRRR